MKPEHLDMLNREDIREQKRARVFSELGIKQPRNKKERYALQRMAKKARSMK